MSSAAATTPQARRTPKDETSPSNAENREEDTWSAEEDEDEDAEGYESHKRKRHRTSRPISVSCERCKERKVGSMSDVCGCL